MKNITKTLLLLIFLGIISCKKELDRLPVSTTDIDAFYKTSNDAEVALLGAYNRVLGSDFNTSLMLFNDVSSDDERGYQFGSTLDGRTDLTKFNSDFGNGMWPTAYNALANINLLLEKVPAIPDNAFLLANRKQQIIGEAKFLRAYVYWHLVHLYGGVPIVLSFPKNANVSDNSTPRSTVDETFAQILLDLKDAEAVLPSDYNVINAVPSENLKNSKGRVTKWAAKMLMCRLYLDKKDYTNAAAKSKEIIDANLFKLSDDPIRDNNYQRLFQGPQNTEESILEVQNIQNEIDQGGFVYLHLGAYPPPFGVTEDLYLNAYTVNGNDSIDIRRAYNIGPANGPYYSLKYRKFFGDPDPDNYIIFRYAETLMIYAEAQNELLGPNATSLNYLNQIKARAKGVLDNKTYPGPPALILPPSTDLMRTEIRNEKRREFALEGIRWYDLLRYGPDVALEAIRKSTGNSLTDPNKLILPIPQREVEVSGIAQNPGY